jgi:hypothetical protein
VEFVDFLCWRCVHEYNVKQRIRRQDTLEIVVLPNQVVPEGLPLWVIPFAEGILPKESRLCNKQLLSL